MWRRIFVFNSTCECCDKEIGIAITQIQLKFVPDLLMLEDLVDKGHGVVQHHLLSKDDCIGRFLHLWKNDYESKKNKVTKKVWTAKGRKGREEAEWKRVGEVRDRDFYWMASGEWRRQDCIMRWNRRHLKDEVFSFVCGGRGWGKTPKWPNQMNTSILLIEIKNKMTSQIANWQWIPNPTYIYTIGDLSIDWYDSCIYK